MKLHNCYEIKTGGKTYKAFNSLAEDFWQKAADNAHWANFLALIAEDGSRVCAPATLEFANCDYSRGGELRARYGAEVMCEQKRYVYAALCCTDSEGGEMSVAPIDINGGGESAEITATVFLEVSAGNGVCLSAGDNPLLRRLLGCGKDGEFSIGWGECDYPAVPCVRSSDLMGEILPARFECGESFRVVSHVPAYGCEIVLYGGNTSAVRALMPYTVSARTVATTVDSRRAVLLSEKPVESILNVSVDGASVLRVEQSRVIKSAFSAVEGKVLNLGVDGEIKGEPGGEYIALVTTGYAEVFEVNDALELKSVLRVEKADEQVELCRGGTLALWGNTVLTLYERDENGTYSSFETSLSAGYDRVIVREGDRYHCGYRRSTAFYRFEITRAGKRQLEQARVTTALFFVGSCGNAMAFGDKTLKVKTIDSDISSDYVCSELASHTQLRNVCGTGDCFVLSTEGNVTYLYDLVHDSVQTVENGLTANGGLAYGNGKAYAYDHYNGLRQIEGNYDVAGASGACLTRSGLWVLKGGKLYVYYLSGGGTAVLMPVDSAGKQAVIGVRERNYKGLGKKAAFNISG